MKFISKDLKKLERQIAGVRDQLGRPSLKNAPIKDWEKSLQQTENILRNISHLINN